MRAGAWRAAGPHPSAHTVFQRRRSAFAITETELRLIAAAAPRDLAADAAPGPRLEAAGGHEADELRLPLGRRAGLVEDDRVDFAQPLDRLGIAEELEREICRCVDELFDTLEPEYADALRSIEIAGLAVKDYAAQRGISASNAGVRVFRAREALRRQVAAACGTCAEHGCYDCTCGSGDEHSCG